MAKKEPTIEDAVNNFFDVIGRCGFSVFRRYDRVLHSKSKKNTGTFFIVEQNLWNVVSEDQDFNEITREFNPLIDADRLILDKMIFTNDMVEGWVPIPDDDMASDKRIFIKLDNFEYEIEINKTLWPIRFRKAENNNFSYKIFKVPFNAFAIRKKFEGVGDETSFYMMRVFRII